MRGLRNLALFFGVCLACAEAFMTVNEFVKTSLSSCYTERKENQVGQRAINGQELPLPNSLETFISLVERYETNFPNRNVEDFIMDLLMSFRCDDIEGMPPLRVSTRGGGSATNINKLMKYFFNLVGAQRYAFQDKDFTPDEQCALHFMLSHTINDTLKGEMNEERVIVGTNEFTKHPREFGVVSLSAKTKHAFALNKVLMGLLAGLKGDAQFDATEIYRKVKNEAEVPVDLNDLKINRLYAITIADVISFMVKETASNNGNSCLRGTGLWNDAVCTSEYALNDYVKCYVTYSYIRGAVDGLILGKSIKKQVELNQKMKLSKILRAYYGPYGFPSDSDATWCRRKSTFANLKSELIDEVVKYDRLFKSLNEVNEPEIEIRKAVSDAVALIDSLDEILKEASDEASLECSPVDATGGKSCETPSDVFAILDYGSTELMRDLQFQVIGNLSVSFDIRESWSSFGVYTNQKPQQGPYLDTIVNSSRISGCPACFAKYYSWRGSRESEIEVMKDLNLTIGDFIENYDNDNSLTNQDDFGTPSKVVLYFNYGSPRPDWELRNSVWEIRRNYREVTILAVGQRKDMLEVFTENTDRDIITDSGNAESVANKLRDRICKVPAEFQYKDCEKVSRGSGTARHEGFVSLNKIQYWAMYPKYFLKSFGIKMKFKSQDGAQVRICYSRYYANVIEDKGSRSECKDSSGDDVEFYASNPCYRKHEGNCDPFYFSIEGKKAPTATTSCDSIRCKALNQIRFEFSHEGIACNSGNFLSTSPLTLLIILFVSISFMYLLGH